MLLLRVSRRIWIVVFRIDQRRDTTPFGKGSPFNSVSDDREHPCYLQMAIPLDERGARAASGSISLNHPRME